ncbi:DUF3800 domain-containing protein [Methanomethylophilus alvi]|uniref:DUF3800 domain-containing protein n=1 Tax=Methanomethylophilus alvi TaxID=1291540 RepID=UPI0037DC584C
MFITYIDESGKPDWNHPEQEFALAALIINEREWVSIDRKVRGLKQKYFPEINPETIEFHATEIFHHKHVFKDLSLDVRINIFEDILRIISESNCTLCCTIINKSLINDKVGTDVNSLATKFLFERICFFLDTENGSNMANGRPEEYNLLMFDSVNPTYDNKVRKMIRVFSANGTGYEHNRYTIEDPIFVNSSYRHLSQLVDCAAYTIHRKFRHTDNEKDSALFDRFYDLLLPALLKRNGKIEGYGIKIYPKQVQR